LAQVRAIKAQATQNQSPFIRPANLSQSHRLCEDLAMPSMVKILSPVLLASGASSMVLRQESQITTFEEYHAAYSRDYTPGSSEYDLRRGLFQQRYGDIQAQNSRSGRLWTAGLNHLTDRTDEELKSLRGWIHHTGGGGPAALIGERSQTYGEPAEAADWRHLQSSKIKDQGACGSCWAVATATMLELNYEIHMNATRSFSMQELVNCVPNPQECGGTGGCQGATVELAMTYTQANGLKTNEETPYLAMDMHCHRHADLESAGIGGGFHQRNSNKFGLSGWSTLPSNKALPLMLSLMEGPTAVSVGATEWMPYASGIFNGCAIDSVIDHAVLAVGYGVEEVSGQKTNYWTIQNSWGPNWGENGYIRLLRMESPEADDAYCGTDARPEEGVACKPYPEKVTVCGMCGVLYDSVAAHFDPSAAPASHLRGKHA